MRRLAIIVLTTAALVGSAAAPSAGSDHTFPDVITLPNGFFPEGIAVGKGHTVYAGSLAGGAIWEGDLRTGAGSILVPGEEGGIAVGMAFDEPSGHLFVAGGPGGTLTVYDTSDGATVAELALGPSGFLNDVIVTNDAAFVTDSFLPQYFVVPLDNRGVPTGAVSAIPFGGEFQAVPGFNANGIEATPDGSTLIVVNSSTGGIFTVDPATGVATLIDLGGAVVNGDGLVLAGRTLYAVVGGMNQIVEISLAADLGSGTVTDVLTSPAFDVPTTAARFGNALYAVNAKFGTAPGPNVPYEVVRVTR